MIMYNDWTYNTPPEALKVIFLIRSEVFIVPSSLCLFTSFCFGIDQVLRSLVPDPMKQEPLVTENTPDPLAGEQVSLISSLTDEGAICLSCYLFWKFTCYCVDMANWGRDGWGWHKSETGKAKEEEFATRDFRISGFLIIF